jgi:hypothetical protein
MNIDMGGEYRSARKFLVVVAYKFQRGALNFYAVRPRARVAVQRESNGAR